MENQEDNDALNNALKQLLLLDTLINMFGSDHTDKVDENRFEFQKKLGEGGFGAALLIKDKSTNELIVMKILKKKLLQSNDDYEKSYDKEVAILKRMNHPNIISFKGGEKDDEGNLIIFTDYADGGTVLDKIVEASENNTVLDEDVRLNYFVQVLNALKHVHENNIIHRDVKPDNVFLTKEGVVKLGDFGIAKSLEYTIELAKTQVG